MGFFPIFNSGKSQTISRVMELLDDGVLANYCTATPGSVTWHEYQLQRMLALQKLKLKSLEHQEHENKELRLLMGDVVEDPHLPYQPTDLYQVIHKQLIYMNTYYLDQKNWTYLNLNHKLSACVPPSTFSNFLGPSNHS